MAVGVVDRLEAVEVDEEQREPAGVGVGLGRGGGEPVLEVDARRQLGQAVDGRRRADRAPRRLVVAVAAAVQRVEHRRGRCATSAATSSGFRPGRQRRRIGVGRHARRRGVSRHARRAGRRRSACSAQLAARLDLEAEADQRASPAGRRRCPGPRRRRRRVARNRPGVANTEWRVGDEQRDDRQAGERGHGLAGRRDRGEEGEAGERPGQRTGQERNAERRCGAVERGEEVAGPPEAEAAEQDGAGLQAERRRPRAQARDGEDLARPARTGPR